MSSKRSRWVVGGMLSAGAVAALVLALLQDGDGVARRDVPTRAQPARAGDEPSAPAKPEPVTSRAAVAAASRAPSVPTTASAIPRAETVVAAKWGSGQRELGRRAGDETSPEGPMSFTVDERGRAFVLDQVNSRVQVFEPGAEPRAIPLPADTFQDVALDARGDLLALDRLTTGSVAYLTRDGQVTHEVGVVGKGVAESGDVTALFERADGTWIEVQHQNLVRIADAAGNPDPDRPLVQGRFAADGAGVLRASRSGDRAVVVALKSAGAPARALARIELELPVWQILALETDARGRIFLGLALQEESGPPAFAIERAAELVVLLDRDGAELARLELPASTGPEESLRRIRLGADGALYHLAFEEQGATLRRVRL